jgi:hypothetical protein
MAVGGSSPLTMRILVRWTMMSETSSSARSSRPPRRSRSSLTTEPSLCSTSTAPRISSCAVSIERVLGQIDAEDLQDAADDGVDEARQRSDKMTKRRMIGATVSAKRSGLEIAQDFGSTSAKITSVTVMAMVA